MNTFQIFRAGSSFRFDRNGFMSIYFLSGFVGSLLISWRGYWDLRKLLLFRNSFPNEAYKSTSLVDILVTAGFRELRTSGYCLIIKIAWD